MDVELENSVQRGVGLLDRKMPDWYRRINTDRLSMISKSNCILGQLYGTYETGLYRLGCDGPDNGFAAKAPFRWGVLHRLWQKEIRRRRAEDVKPVQPQPETTNRPEEEEVCV